jgi:hypothetical protein
VGNIATVGGDNYFMKTSINSTTVIGISSGSYGIGFNDDILSNTPMEIRILSLIYKNMTLKEQMMKYLLEDAVASLILRASVVGGGGATDFEGSRKTCSRNLKMIFQMNQILMLLKDKALSSVCWIDLGKVNEVVGST